MFRYERTTLLFLGPNRLSRICPSLKYVFWLTLDRIEIQFHIQVVLFL